MEDQKKLKGKYKDSGAIEFTFDLNKEVPEAVAQEMVSIFLLKFHYMLCPKTNLLFFLYSNLYWIVVKLSKNAVLYSPFRLTLVCSWRVT